MRARIVILPTGQISIFVEEGTFEDAKQSLNRFLAELEAQGLDLESVTGVEQHRHAAQHLEVKHRVPTT